MYKPKPLKLGHLVLKVRNIRESVEFYTNVVGLQVSDWIDDRMVFLRAGHDHHDLALVQLPGSGTARPAGEYPSIEHFSYQVENIEEIEKITKMLQERGIEIDRGPGRHGPGDNTFIVFNDPDGNLVEFYSDMTQINEDNPYDSKVWNGLELETFDQWHLKKFVVDPPERIKAIIENK